jgi:hypothetical protein
VIFTDTLTVLPTVLPGPYAVVTDTPPDGAANNIEVTSAVTHVVLHGLRLVGLCKLA